MGGDFLDENVKPGLRKAYQVDKKKLGLQQTLYFKPEMLVQDVCGLLQISILFKMRRRSGKIKIAVKVFQRSIMICIFSTLMICSRFSTRKKPRM